MTHADLKPWIEFIQIVMIPLLGYILKILWDIREHLARLNGRVGTCEALHRAHEADDDKKHDMCEERLQAVEQKLMRTR